MNLSLRAKLTLWFGLVMAVSLAVFGALTYTSISNQLRTGLDVALNSAVEGLVVTLHNKAEEAQMEEESPKKKRSGGSTHTDTSQPEIDFLRGADSAKADSATKPSITPAIPNKPSPAAGQTSVDNAWASIAEYVVLNPRNFMVQVMDSTGAVVFRSASLATDTLDLSKEFLGNADTSVSRMTNLVRIITDSQGKPVVQSLRVAMAKFRSAVIVVAYPDDEVQASLDDFLRTLMLLIPVVLAVSIIGGWFLARASLHPVDEITRTAQDITASNLSRRLPVGRSNDEIKRLTETLNDMISRLESSFSRIRQFTADASHELRTPLTILTGELELTLRAARTREEYQEVISSALQETLRMSRVVEDLLLLSRADMGRVKVQTDSINLNEMLADLADATAILGAKKDLSITYRQEDETLYVQGDHSRLYQTFLNLLDNAIKYTSHGGSVSLTLHRDGNTAEVRVRDTGIGISPEHQKKIFDRFYRVDKARSRAQGGVGLGLAIVEWTVRAHEGTIEVESEPGYGSTFIVRLPLGPESVREENVANPRNGERHGIAGTFDLPKFLKRGRHDEREGPAQPEGGEEHHTEN